MILALLTCTVLLTGARFLTRPEPATGIVVHVDLERALHPAPEGHEDWKDVTPSPQTGPKYRWAPSGTVIVMLDVDGRQVEAMNPVKGVGYESRVRILRTRDGEWRVVGSE